MAAAERASTTRARPHDPAKAMTVAAAKAAKATRPGEGLRWGIGSGRSATRASFEVSSKD